jgi:hypothetical protein
MFMENLSLRQCGEVNVGEARVRILLAIAGLLIILSATALWDSFR